MPGTSGKKILILVVILALPGFLYYMLQDKGKNRYRPLDIFGPKEVAKTFHSRRGKKIPDTIYHQVPAIKLSNQNGAEVTIPDSTKITVVGFFYSRCPGFCRNMNLAMQRVATIYQKNPVMRFTSITVDPAHDQGEILKKYAEGFKAQSGKWDFLTGDKAGIYNLATRGFLLDAQADSASENIIHSPMLVLVDLHQRIRGYYDSNNKEQVDKLIDEIKVLITEDLREKKI